MNIDQPCDKIKKIYNEILDSDLKFNGDINNIDFYSLLCLAASKNYLYKFFTSSVTMFNYEYENTDSILIIFSIPIILNKEITRKENKHVSERVMEIIQVIEEVFITVDHMILKNIPDEKFYYLIIVKKLI